MIDFVPQSVELFNVFAQHLLQVSVEALHQAVGQRLDGFYSKQSISSPVGEDFFRKSDPGKLSSHLLAVRERESGSKQGRNYVYLSKIENSS